MSYGIKLINNYGESLVNGGSSFYEYETGTCQTQEDSSYAAVYPDFRGFYVPTSYGNPMEVWYFGSHYGGTSYFKDPISGNSVKHPSSEYDRSTLQSPLILPQDNPLGVLGTFDLDDALFFYELKSYGVLVSLSGAYTPSDPSFPSSGMMSMVLTQPYPYSVTADKLKYKIASTDTSTPVTGNYGMQLRNASNEVYFDSRRKFLPILDYYFLSQSQVLDILNNDAVYTHTLRSSKSELYFNASQFYGYKSTLSGSTLTTHMLRMRKTANNEVTFDRVTFYLYNCQVATFNAEVVIDSIILFH